MAVFSRKQSTLAVLAAVFLLLFFFGCTRQTPQGAGTGAENCGEETCVAEPPQGSGAGGTGGPAVSGGQGTSGSNPGGPENPDEPEKSVEPTLGDIEGAPEGEPQNPEISLSVSADKTTYGSSEEVRLTVVAVSSQKAENALVMVWGITPYSTNYIEDQRTVGLEEGGNQIVFTETTPRCTSGCGGVKPGPYAIHASVSLDGEIIAEAETEINLVSG